MWTCSLRPVDNTLFEVSPEIRCSGELSVATVVMETTQLVLSYLNTFYDIN